MDWRLFGEPFRIAAISSLCLIMVGNPLERLPLPLALSLKIFALIM